MQSWADHLSKGAIVLAMIGFFATFAISYRSAGLAEGLTVGEIELNEFKASIGNASKVHFAADGEGTYFRFARDYDLMTWLFGLAVLSMIAGRFQQRTKGAVVVFAVTLVSFTFILYKLSLLIRDKAIMESYFWEAPRNRFAYQTITYDWLLAGLTCCLMISVAALSVGPIRKLIAEWQRV